MDKNRSMVDVAYELMSKKKKAVNFYKLWQEVSEIKGFNAEEKEENESLFYTNITLNTDFFHCELSLEPQTVIVFKISVFKYFK